MPWGADVKIADENIGISSRKKSKGSTIYNGAQGAAYFMIRFFQVFISPQDGPNCRFRPTCSAYGKTAVQRYGVIYGSFLAGDRILRCNPYSAPGDDPVPDSIFY